MKISFLLVIAAVTVGYSQTCTTGTVDERATAYLKSAGTGPSITQLRSTSIETLRKSAAVKPIPADSVKRLTVTADKIKVNVYRGSNQPNLPVIIHFHAGGFIIPLQPSMEREALHLAKRLNAVVFDIDYRVAPEHKHPAAVQDAYQAVLWVLEHAQEYGGSDQVFLMGTDAGAALAALSFNRAKMESKGELIKGIIMICPLLDNPMVSFHASLDDNATGYGLTKDLVQFYFQTYLDKPVWFTPNAEVWPFYIKDLTGWPSTLIVTTEFDVLRDEGIAFGKKLEQARNTVTIKCYPHQLHNFYGLPASSEELTRVHELIMEVIAGKKK